MNKYICVKRRREKEDETKVYKWTACRYDGSFTACRIAGTGEPKRMPCVKTASGNASSPARNCPGNRVRNYVSHGAAGVTASPHQSCWPRAPDLRSPTCCGAPLRRSSTPFTAAIRAPNVSRCPTVQPSGSEPTPRAATPRISGALASLQTTGSLK